MNKGGNFPPFFVATKKKYNLVKKTAVLHESYVRKLQLFIVFRNR